MFGYYIGVVYGSYAPSRCRTSQHHRTFIILSVSLRTVVADLVFDGVGLVDFKRRPNASLLAEAACSLSAFYCSISLLSLYRFVFWGWGLRTNMV